MNNCAVHQIGWNWYNLYQNWFMLYQSYTKNMLSQSLCGPLAHRRDLQGGISETGRAVAASCALCALAVVSVVLTYSRSGIPD